MDTFAESEKALEKKRYHVVVTDLKMAGPSGLDVLHKIRDRGYPTQAILISGYASLEAARDAEAVGAFDFLCKPFELKDLTKLVKKAAKRAKRGVGCFKSEQVSWEACSKSELIRAAEPIG